MSPSPQKTTSEFMDDDSSSQAEEETNDKVHTLNLNFGANISARTSLFDKNFGAARNRSDSGEDRKTFH